MARICINLHRTSHVTMVPYQNMAEKAVFLTVFFENYDFVRCLHFQGPTRHICRGVCDAMSSDIQKGDGFAGQADLTMFTINAFAFRGKTTAHYGMITPDYKKTRPQQNLNNFTATAIMVLIFKTVVSKSHTPSSSTALTLVSKLVYPPVPAVFATY